VKNMYLLPSIEPSDLLIPPHDGKLIKAYSFCKKLENRSRCSKFLDSVKKISGYYICPFGFTCYVKHQENNIFITCSIRVAEYYTPKKANPKVEVGEPHVLSEDFVTKCVNESISTSTLNKKVDEVKEFLEVTLHEIRKLNRDIKSQAEELNITLSSDNLNKEFLKYRVQNIFSTSSLISVRLDTFDVLFNPGIISSNTPIPFYIYKKFEKTMHCLDNQCKQKKIRFNVHGSSYASIDAYPVLELLPYVLLENALKYSPEDNEIKIIFNNEQVIIENIGPHLAKNEINSIFERTVRGKHARGHISGTGNGLFFAKQVCDLHGIKIHISTDEKPLYQMYQVPYSLFRIILDFK
jgi:light-regulated signal transduction histidine kinase (bacteriophytochrome)